MRARASRAWGVAPDWWAAQPRCTAKSGWITLAAADTVAQRARCQVAACTVGIEHVATDGTVTMLKRDLELLEGEVIDGTFMSRSALDAFLAKQVDDARATGVLFSLHMKATMMKVSDPIIFGHCVSVFYENVIQKYSTELESIGFDQNNGIGGFKFDYV